MLAQIVESQYSELIDQSFEFPQGDFYTENGELHFHGIPIMDIIKQYGTPLKLTYLPQISNQIQKAKTWFNVAMAKANYQGKYQYCYCTKSSHFSFVLEEAIKNDIHLETSSEFDISIIQNLIKEKKINRDIYVICNGYKKIKYKKQIVDLIKDGFTNVIPIIDHKEELEYYENAKLPKQKVGIRIAAEEEPNFEFYTSRLGIRYSEILDFYKSRLKDSPRFELKMLHFFINTGIEDTAYYWTELLKCINVYCELRKICPTLDSMDIGGGFPIRNSLGFEYDYQYMADEIILKIKSVCEQEGVPEPDIFTEFGKFTVGESGAVL
ncbi:MAG: arginine decarboxylase, partial [Bacteroidia bacterium]|nr:arginine decarboxylase [Bacteroidia bacterium]